MCCIAKLAPYTSLLALLTLAGCSNNATLNSKGSSSSSGSSTVSTPDVAITRYYAYGDSITAGYLLASPGTQDYPALVASKENVPANNRAFSGEMACDLPPSQIFYSGDSPALSPHIASSVLIGTNDVDIKGVGAYEAVFTLCHEATLSWLGVPVEYKVLANGSGMKTYGPGAIDTTNHWNAWTTGGKGSTVSFTIITPTTGPIYAWPIIDDTNSSTYTYSLDGVVKGTGTTKTTPAIATQNGVTNSLGFIRFSPVAAGTHVITFTQTSEGADGVSVVGIGAPDGSPSGALPTVFAGTIPYQYPGPSGGPCTAATDQPCQEYIQDIQADVSLFTSDGLDIRVFDTRLYMLGTAAEMTDALHPNVLGQMKLSQSLEAVW
jgi:lysophospholipase L1-like esterase